MPDSMDAGAAMLVVHGWALAGNALFGNRDETALLHEAAVALQEDVGFDRTGAESRRRRAISLIAGRDLDDPSALGALRELDAPIERIRRLLRQNPGWQPRERETKICDLLHALPGAPALECPWKELTTRVSYDDVVTADACLLMRRSIGSLSRAIDPQCWDSCSPYFRWTYKATDGSLGEPDSKNPRLPPPDPEPPPSGSPWGGPDGRLYEHFELDFKLASSEFQNTLKVKCTETRQHENRIGFRIDYDLGLSLCSRVGPSRTRGGILVDRGWIDARTDSAPGWVRIDARKQIKFDDRGWGLPGKLLDAWAAPLLLAMASQLAEMACCSDGCEPDGGGA